MPGEAEAEMIGLDGEHRASPAGSIDDAGIEGPADFAAEHRQNMSRADIAPGQGKLDFCRPKENDVHVNKMDGSELDKMG